jgi:hypothetical protein
MTDHNRVRDVMSETPVYTTGTWRAAIRRELGLLVGERFGDSELVPPGEWDALLREAAKRARGHAVAPLDALRAESEPDDELATIAAEYRSDYADGIDTRAAWRTLPRK